MSEFEVRTSPLDGACLFRLSGRGERKAVAKIQEAVDASEAKHLVFECAGVDFFNSTALGYFINLSDAVRKIGGSVAFCRVSKKVRVAFDLLGLDEFFTFHPDEAKAAEALRGAADSSEVPEEWARGEIVLPSWLDETPPLHHPRWIAVMQAAGFPSQAIRGLLLRHSTAEDLLATLDASALSRIGAAYGVPPRIPAIVDFVHRSTAESLLRPTRSFDAGALVRELQEIRPPRTVKTDVAARALVAAQIGKAHPVVRGKPAIVVEGKFGLVVKMGTGLAGARLAPVLGNLLLLSPDYETGSLFLVAVGKVVPNDDLRRALDRLGVRWVPIG